MDTTDLFTPALKKYLDTIVLIILYGFLEHDRTWKVILITLRHSFTSTENNSSGRSSVSVQSDMINHFNWKQYWTLIETPGVFSGERRPNLQGYAALVDLHLAYI